MTEREMQRMKAFWNDCGSGVTSAVGKDVNLPEARQLWADLSGVEGNFFGLIDEQDRTIQFYLDDGIPDEVEDARHLRIVQMDFADVDNDGSYVRRVAIGEVQGLIETAFQVGADPRQFSGLQFESWL
jgi:hypothetical protein